MRTLNQPLLKIEKRQLIPLFCLLLFGCSKSEPENKMEQQLHGKYEIVEAKSLETVDINLDGVSGQNLLSEIQELKYSKLELLAAKNPQSLIYSQFWQNQYFLGTEQKPTNYDPSVVVNYMNQPTVANFKIDQQQKQLILSRSVEDPEFPLPSSVEIMQDNKIRVKMTKEVYTRSGMTTIHIDVLYSKYTSEF